MTLREQFEEWAWDEIGIPIIRHTQGQFDATGMHYSDGAIDAAWAAWQASRSAALTECVLPVRELVERVKHELQHYFNHDMPNSETDKVWDDIESILADLDSGLAPRTWREEMESKAVATTPECRDADRERTAFTPGPWFQTVWDHIECEEGRIIAEVYGAGDNPDAATEEGKANGLLIAAAPDLYHELAHLVRLLDGNEHLVQVPGFATLNGAKAALEKAAQASGEVATKGVEDAVAGQQDHKEETK